MKKLVLMCAMLLCLPMLAKAQVTKLGPNATLTVTLPALPIGVDPDGLDAPDGSRIFAVRPGDMNFVLKTWDVVKPDTSKTLTTADLPGGAFSLYAKPYNVAGVATGAPINVVGPFGKAAIPPPFTTGVAVSVGGAP